MVWCSWLFLCVWYLSRSYYEYWLWYNLLRRSLWWGCFCFRCLGRRIFGVYWFWNWFGLFWLLWWYELISWRWWCLIKLWWWWRYELLLLGYGSKMWWRMKLLGNESRRGWMVELWGWFLGRGRDELVLLFFYWWMFW